ncbi:hypothetical protein SESBI_27243 [Sesbania bispinosa]|nr:hypothetical protein SESBI_27243 [Sesbania bispinosa]
MSVAVVEKVLRLVETKQLMMEGMKDTMYVMAILNKVMKVSSVTTDHEVTTLCSLCFLFWDQKAYKAITHANGFTKILLLIQSSCSFMCAKCAPIAEDFKG